MRHNGSDMCTINKKICAHGSRVRIVALLTEPVHINPILCLPGLPICRVAVHPPARITAKYDRHSIEIFSMGFGMKMIQQDHEQVPTKPTADTPEGMSTSAGYTRWPKSREDTSISMDFGIAEAAPMHLTVLWMRFR